MITRRIRLQLGVFAIVTAVVVWYGATRLLGLGAIVHPPYRVEMQVANAGGLYPRADVDLLGTRVGRVDSLRPGPGRSSIVVMLIDQGVRVPVDVRGAVGSRSAIGEGFVQLTPRSAGGPFLHDGSTIPLADTSSPVPLEDLLHHLDALVSSIPLRDLDTLLRQGGLALDGISASVGRLVAGTQRLTGDALANVDRTTALLRRARVVLGTQVDLGPQTLRWTRQLAGLLARLRQLDPTLAHLYDTGLRASTGVTNLLADNQPLLPVLLSNLVTLTTVAQQRVPKVRKTLAVFPWILENQVNSARYCDDYDARTGRPDPSTCHYDRSGSPIYSLHLAQQLDKLGANPYQACTRGYEDTERYRPDKAPVDGTGPREPRGVEPNLRAHCDAPPTDPVSPNVRGAQNVTTPAYARGDGATTGSGSGPLALYDPQTGLVTDGSATARVDGVHGPPPPTGPAGLAWLLTAPLERS